MLDKYAYLDHMRHFYTHTIVLWNRLTFLFSLAKAALVEFDSKEITVLLRNMIE
jgi:hypothetical protein